MAYYSVVQTATMVIILKYNKKVNWSGETGSFSASRPVTSGTCVVRSHYPIFI